MSNFEKIIKEYSSKKLKEILEKQSDSYNENFIDYINDELIRRGESIPLNAELEQEISAMSDEELKNLVENEWNDYHLEYLELSRNEYIKRGFKNKTPYNEQEEETENKDARYPALNTVISLNNVGAWILGILAIGLGIYFIKESLILYAISTIVIGALIVLFTVASSESIKVIIDIEENTRKSKE
jgi:hypothetical protein